MDYGVCEDKWLAIKALNIKNAFNSTPRTLDIGGLKSKLISLFIITTINSNFLECKIKLEKNIDLKVTADEIQGAFLWPTIWNIIYNNVLDLRLAEGCESVAFGDELEMINQTTYIDIIIWYYQADFSDNNDPTPHG